MGHYPCFRHRENALGKGRSWADSPIQLADDRATLRLAWDAVRVGALSAIGTRLFVHHDPGRVTVRAWGIRG
jgi:hypothetical protein